MYLYIPWKRQLPRAFTALFSWLPHYPPTLYISRKGLSTMYSLEPQHQLIETSLYEPLKLILPSSINSPRALAFDFLSFLPFLNLMEPLACSLCLLAILQLSRGWLLFPPRCLEVGSVSSILFIEMPPFLPQKLQLFKSKSSDLTLSVLHHCVHLLTHSHFSSFIKDFRPWLRLPFQLHLCHYSWNTHS